MWFGFLFFLISSCFSLFFLLNSWAFALFYWLLAHFLLLKSRFALFKFCLFRLIIIQLYFLLTYLLFCGQYILFFLLCNLLSVGLVLILWVALLACFICLWKVFAGVVFTFLNGTFLIIYYSIKSIRVIFTFFWVFVNFFRFFRSTLATKLLINNDFFVFFFMVLRLFLVNLKFRNWSCLPGYLLISWNGILLISLVLINFYVIFWGQILVLFVIWKYRILTFFNKLLCLWLIWAKAWLIAEL